MINNLWRSSNAPRVFISLLLIITPTFVKSMEQSDYTALSEETEEKQEPFGDYPVSLLEKAFQDGPPKYKALCKKLADREYMKYRQLRASFFVGEPGTGKTTATVALAYKLKKEFDYDIINCPTLVGQHRGQAKEKLEARLNEILQKDSNDNRGMIVIFDEAEDLFARADDPHFDTGTTTRYIISSLNDSMSDSNKHFIFTMNNYDTVSAALASRMRSNTIKFKAIKSAGYKIKIFKDILTQRNIKLDKTCDDAFFMKYLGSVQGWEMRDFEAAVNDAVDIYLEKHDHLSNVVLTPMIVIDAIDLVDEEIEEFRNRPRVVTEFEQREKHHRESISTQKNLHTESLKAQREMWAIGLEKQLEMHGDSLEKQDESIRSHVAMHPLGIVVNMVESLCADDKGYDIYGKFDRDARRKKQ